MEITFLGAAGTVTGSKYLVTTGRTRILVDCGMFQGPKALRERNREGPPVAPDSLDAVVLTHAHLDHTGYLPVLVRLGFAGPIRCTSGTAALAGILLPDSAMLQEEDARRANLDRSTRHAPALPLYTWRDVERTLPLLVPTAWDTPFDVGDLRVTFAPAGHILGAASVRVEHAGRSAVFSGDVGRPHDLLMRPPRPFAGADLLVIEGTYGDRLHPEGDPEVQLADIVNRVCGRGGVLLVPAFAVGRTQALLHLLARLRARGAIPAVPTFLDSPLGISATGIFAAHPEDHRLTAEECAAMYEAAVFTRDAKESGALDVGGGPMIIVAGSGMATGGRILQHLEAYGHDPRNGVLMVGYQAVGTRGAAIEEGADTLRIHGRTVPVRAERFTMDGMSGHADWRELVGWMGGAAAPSQVFVSHAEPGPAYALRIHVQEELGWAAQVAREGETVTV